MFGRKEEVQESEWSRPIEFEQVLWVTKRSVFVAVILGTRKDILKYSQSTQVRVEQALIIRCILCS